MASRFKTAAGRAALVVTAGVLALTALEAALRWLPRRAFRESDRSLRYVAPEPSRQHPWSRGAADPLRIAVVGDSVAFGSGVQPCDTYGARLEWMLNINPTARPAEVHVFARPGTNPDGQQWQELPQALAIRPHLLVLGLCLNDAESTKRRDEIKDWRRRMLTRPPPRWLAPALRVSRAAAWLYRKKEDRRINRAYYDYYRFLYNPRYDGWQRLTNSIGHFQEECDAAGVPFMVLVVPLLTDLRATPYPFDYVHDQIAEFLRGRRIPSLDLRGALLGLDPRRLEVQPGVDPHPDEIAHRIMAEALFDYLISEGRIPAEYQIQGENQAEVHGIWDALQKQREVAPRP